MPLSDESLQLKKTIIVAIFASLAVVLGIIELLIPFTVAVPGAKLGLGNIMVLTCLLYFSWREAFTLIVIKTLLTSFLLGAFSTFLFSFLGALASFIVMSLMLKVGRQSFSLIMVSVMGGIFHNIGQLGAAAIVLGTTKIVYYLPVLLVSGILTGVVIGLGATYLKNALNRISLFEMLGGEHDAQVK